MLSLAAPNCVCSALLAPLIICVATPALAANAISRAIEQAQPCSALKTEKFGVNVGIDIFKSADLETLKIEVNGNNASIAFVGSLACRTSDKAVVRGDASARFSAATHVDLGSCAVSDNAVQILSTGGTFGVAVEAFKPQIEKAVANAFVDAAKNLCQ